MKSPKQQTEKTRVFLGDGAPIWPPDPQPRDAGKDEPRKGLQKQENSTR